MTKYERAINDLAEGKQSQMRVFGQSMKPIIKSGSMLTFEAAKDYVKGDVVFCKCNGRYVDAHLITAKGPRGYLISNNHGWDNGWTKTIYGKAVHIEPPTK